MKTLQAANRFESTLIESAEVRVPTQPACSSTLLLLVHGHAQPRRTQVARRSVENSGAVVSTDVIHCGVTPTTAQPGGEVAFDGAKLCTVAYRMQIIRSRIVALETEVCPALLVSPTCVCC